MALDTLLSKTNEILTKSRISSEESSVRGERFNIFDVLGIDSDELSHSDVIAELLNPKGTHGQGNAFLELFLKTLQPDFTFDADHASVTVAREVSVGKDGRIDILITNDMKQAIIIENKIYAPDQPEQLRRYDSYAEKTYGKGNYRIIYLTLDGHEASDQSRGDIVYTSLSYRNDILSWVDHCIRYASTMPLIRETLIQYRALIKKLTNQNMEQKLSDELLATMAANADAVAAITNAQDKFRKYAFERYVRPEFQVFADEQELKYEEHNLFDCNCDRGFCFYKEEWSNMAIWVYSETKRSFCEFYIGVSSIGSIPMKMPIRQLRCLSRKANNYWPFGWAWLGKYSDWDMNTVAAMVSGEFASFILSKIAEILEELKQLDINVPNTAAHI